MKLEHIANPSPMRPYNFLFKVFFLNPIIGIELPPAISPAFTNLEFYLAET